MDYYKLKEKRSVTPEKLVSIIQKHGTVVSIEKARKVLELIYKMSNLSMRETLSHLPNRRLKMTKRRFTRQERKKKENEDS